nr:zinc finger, CCHC-type [Tanacetum cinerariifolium]
MTTSVGNNSVFKSLFEKQKFTRPNFIDWYRQLHLVLSTEDNENYLEHPIPVAPPGQQNYNMHGIGKTMIELHAMLKLHEETLPKKDANPALHAIQAGRTPPPPKKDNPSKESICHQCGEVGHWRRNCLVYLAELMKKKKLSQGASTSGSTRNNNMQTHTSNTLHNAIMEAGSKDRPPMLAPGNYVWWKSRIKRYIDTKPNHELIHYCLKNPPYKLDWNDIEVLVSEGSPITTTARIHETYKNVSQEIKDQLNAEAEAVQIILTGIDNDIYSTVDACPNACEMWKAIERLKQDDETSKDKEIDKLMALISLSFKKIYKHTNNNLRTSSNTSRANQDNSLTIHQNAGYETQRNGNVAGARENVGSSVQADWRDDIDAVELEDQELEPHYMYMAQLQEVSPDDADSGPIFDDEPIQKVSNDDHYNVFALESVHPEQSKSMHDTYPIEQDAQNVIIDSLDMSYDREEIDQNDDDNDLAKERELLASLNKKLKCEIDESKNRNKFLETSNKVLVEKLKGEIEDFKNKNKSLESSNNFFKEANNKLSETNNLLYADYKKSEAELTRRNSKEYASQMELECAKVREMKDKLSAHQETISILSKQKEAQIKLYKTYEDKELEKVIELENQLKVLDNIVYKTGQSVQTINMLNNKCRTSFTKPEFLKKAQRANPRLYDIGCYNDNLVLMLAPDSDEVIRLEKESRSKLSYLIRLFDYDKMNNLYDLFVSQREKSSERRYFSERSS